MSLKPPKKSDLDKSWMKTRRDKPKKIQPEYHLIITEGTNTEPTYFGTMRDISKKQCKLKNLSSYVFLTKLTGLFISIDILKT